MTVQDNRPSRPPLSFTVFDSVGLAFAGFALLGSVFAVVEFQPTFRKMLADFGDPPLPALTELCLQPWFPLVLGIVPLGMTCIGILRHAPRRIRAVLMGLTIFLSLALPGVFLLGVFLVPPLPMVGAIK